jgi:anti-sigma B factor antagonist
MDITVQDEAGTMIITIAGELEATRGSELGQVCDRLLAEGRRKFVIDLKDVKFVDSSGLSTLIRCLKRVRSNAGNLILINLQSPVRRVIELTRLDRAFDIQADIPKSRGASPAAEA